MKKLKFWLVLVVAIVSVWGMGSVLLKTIVRPATPPSGVVRPVKSMVVGDITKLGSRTFPGRAEPTHEALLSFRVAGPLVEFPVIVGQKVNKGDLIARVDPRDYEVRVRDLNSNLKQAEATLKMMRAGARPEDVRNLEASVEVAKAQMKEVEDNYARIKNLYERKAVSSAEYDKVTAAHDIARAQLETAQQNLIKAKAGARVEDIEAMEAQIESIRAKMEAASYAVSDTSLRAPFAGVISMLLVENYQTVSAGQPIVKLVDHSQIEITVDVPEEAVHYHPYVQKAVCSFQTIPDRTFDAKVKEISTVASPQTLTYPVTVIMPSPSDCEIFPGMTAEVRFIVRLPDNGKIASGFEVPETAVFQDKDGNTAAWLLDMQTMSVRKSLVKVGKMSSHGIIVTSGLNKGDRIVIAGVHFLTEGQKVKLLE